MQHVETVESALHDAGRLWRRAAPSPLFHLGRSPPEQYDGAEEHPEVLGEIQAVAERGEPYIREQTTFEHEKL